jgi:hypothetical protein
MSITLNDNLSIQAPKPADARYGPYADTATANAAIDDTNRYKGLTVGIGTVTGTGTITEYWYKAGITNSNLVVKRIDSRVYVAPTNTLGTTLTPDISAYDQYCATAQATNLTINTPNGTPANGDKLIFRIKADSTNRTVTLTTGSSGAFRAIGVTLPVTVTASKTTYIGCIYNSEDQRWDVVAVSQEI